MLEEEKHHFQTKGLCVCVWCESEAMSGNCVSYCWIFHGEIYHRLHTHLFVTFFLLLNIQVKKFPPCLLINFINSFF